MANENANNPYSFIGAHYSAGLDSIIGALTPPTIPTFDAFLEIVYDYIETGLYDVGDVPDKLEKQEIKVWINSTISSYINANRTINDLHLSDAQLQYASQLVNGVLTLNNPEDIYAYIADVQEKILYSKLTAPEQLPLLYATAVGLAAYDYWKVRAFPPPAGGLWMPYSSTSFTPAINKFPSWISASMEAVLISISNTSNQSDNSLITSIYEAMNKVQGRGIVMAVGGTLGVAAGKVLYKWTQKTAL